MRIHRVVNPGVGACLAQEQRMQRRYLRIYALNTASIAVSCLYVAGYKFKALMFFLSHFTRSARMGLCLWPYSRNHVTSMLKCALSPQTREARYPREKRRREAANDDNEPTCAPTKRTKLNNTAHVPIDVAKTKRPSTRLYVCFSSRHYLYLDIPYCQRRPLEDQRGHETDMRV